MVGDGNISVRYFSLDTNGQLYLNSEERDILKVIGSCMDNILQKNSVVMLKNNEIVAAAVARKNYTTNENDLLDFYYTNKFSRNMTFSEDEIVVGKRMSPGYFSFNIYDKRRIRHGESRGQVDYTRTPDRIIEDEFYRMWTRGQADDILGLCESGSNHDFLSRLKNGCMWHERAFKRSGNLGRKLDEGLKLRPQNLA